MGRSQHTPSSGSFGSHKRPPPPVVHAPGKPHTTPASLLSLEYIDFAALVEEVQGNVVAEKRLLPRSWVGRFVLTLIVSLSLVLLKETAFRNTRLESADISMHMNIQEACRRSNDLRSEECQAHQYNLARKASFGSSAFEKVHEALYGKLPPVHVMIIPAFVIFIHLVGSGKSVVVPRKQAVGIIPTVISALHGRISNDGKELGTLPPTGPTTLPLAMSTSTWLPTTRAGIDWQETIYNMDLTSHVYTAADGDFGCTRPSFILEQIVFGHSIACLLVHFVTTPHVPDVSMCCLLATARLFISQTTMSSWFFASEGRIGKRHQSRRPQVSTRNVLEWIAWGTLFAFLFFPHSDSGSTPTPVDVNFQPGDGEGVDSAMILGSEEAASMYAGGLKITSRSDTPPAPNHRYAFHWTVVSAHLPLVPVVVPTHLLEYVMGFFGRARAPLSNIASSSTDADSLMAANEIIMKKYYPSVRLLSPCGPTQFSVFQRHVLNLTDRKAFKRAESDPRRQSPFAGLLLNSRPRGRFASPKPQPSKNKHFAQLTPEIEAALDACSPHRGGSPPMLLQEAFLVDEWQSTTVWGCMMWYSLTFCIVYCLRMSGFAVDSRAWLATSVQHNGIRGINRLLQRVLTSLTGATNIAVSIRAALWTVVQLLIFTCSFVPTVFVRVFVPLMVYMFICAIENGIAVPWPTSSMVILISDEQSLIFPRVMALRGAIPLVKLLLLLMISYGFGVMQFVNDGVSPSTSYAMVRRLCAAELQSPSTQGTTARFVSHHPCAVLSLLHYAMVFLLSFVIFLFGLLSPTFAVLVSPLGSLGVDLIVGHMIGSRMAGLLDYALVTLLGTDIWWGYSSATGQKRTAPQVGAPYPRASTVISSWISWVCRFGVLFTTYVGGIVCIIQAHHPAKHFLVPSTRTDHATYTQRLLKHIPDSLCAAASLLFLIGITSRIFLRLHYWQSLRAQQRALLPLRIAEAEAATASLVAQQVEISNQSSPISVEVHPAAPVDVPRKVARTPTPPPPSATDRDEDESDRSSTSTAPTSNNGSSKNHLSDHPHSTAAASSSTTTTPTPEPAASSSTNGNHDGSLTADNSLVLNGKKKRRQERKEAAEKERMLEEAKREQERLEKLEKQRLAKERKEKRREEHEAEEVRRLESERRQREEMVQRAEEQQRLVEEELRKRQETKAQAAPPKAPPKPPVVATTVTHTDAPKPGAPRSIDDDELAAAAHPPSVVAKPRRLLEEVDDTKVTVAIPLPASKSKKKQEAEKVASHTVPEAPQKGKPNKMPTAVLPPRPMFEEEDFSSLSEPTSSQPTSATITSGKSLGKKPLDPVSAAIAGVWGNNKPALINVPAIASSIDSDPALPTLPPVAPSPAGSIKQSKITAVGATPPPSSPLLVASKATPGTSPARRPTDNGRTGPVLPLMAPLPAGQRSYASAVASTRPIGATPPTGSLADSSSFCSNNFGGASFATAPGKLNASATTNQPGDKSTTPSQIGSPIKTGTTNKSGSFRFAPGALGASLSSSMELDTANDDVDPLPQLPPLTKKPNKSLKQQSVGGVSRDSKSQPLGPSRHLSPVGGPAAIGDEDTFDGLPSLPHRAPSTNHMATASNGSKQWLAAVDNRPRSTSSYSAGSVKTQDEPIISIQVVDDAALANTVTARSEAPSSINPSSPTTLHQLFDDLLISFPDPPHSGGEAALPFGSHVVEPAVELARSTSDDSLSSALFADVQGEDDDDLPANIWGSGTAAPRNAVYHNEPAPTRGMDDDDGFVVESGSGLRPASLQATAVEFLPKGFKSPPPLGAVPVSTHPSTPNQYGGPVMPSPQPQPIHILEQKLVYLQNANTHEQQPRLMVTYSNGQTAFHPVVFAQPSPMPNPYYPGQPINVEHAMHGGINAHHIPSVSVHQLAAAHAYPGDYAPTYTPPTSNNVSSTVSPEARHRNPHGNRRAVTSHMNPPPPRYAPSPSLTHLHSNASLSREDMGTAHQPSAEQVAMGESGRDSVVSIVVGTPGAECYHRTVSNISGTQSPGQGHLTMSPAMSRTQSHSSPTQIKVGGKIVPSPPLNFFDSQTSIPGPADLKHRADVN